MPTVFACLDVEHPVVAWAAYRGVLVSSLAEAKQEGCSVSMMLAGMFLYGDSVRFQNELEIEQVRQKRYSTLPSRLAAMYFFESSKDVERIAEWGGHFSKDNMVELDLYPTSPVSRHDSNWITYAPLDQTGRIRSTEWIDAYWKGEPASNWPPIWELLAQGRAVVFGTELRERAYRTIKAHSPAAMSILEISRIAAILRSDLGQTKAFLIDNANGTASITYCLDMREANDPNFLARVKNYNGPKNHSDLKLGGDTFGVPDFRSFTSTFSIDEPFAEVFLQGIHTRAEI